MLCPVLIRLWLLLIDMEHTWAPLVNSNPHRLIKKTKQSMSSGLDFCSFFSSTQSTVTPKQMLTVQRRLNHRRLCFDSTCRPQNVFEVLKVVFFPPGYTFKWDNCMILANLTVSKLSKCPAFPFKNSLVLVILNVTLII